MDWGLIILEYAIPAALIIGAIYALRRCALGSDKPSHFSHGAGSPWRYIQLLNTGWNTPMRLPWAKDVAEREQCDFQHQADWLIDAHIREKQDRLRR